jgi:hypothetical protein
VYASLRSGATQTKGPNDNGGAIFSIAPPGSWQWQEWELKFVDQFTDSGLVGIRLSDLSATNN